MKAKITILLSLLFLVLQGCDSETDTELIKVATPKFMTIEDLRASVAITDPVPIVNSGKIYAYGDFIFINDIDKGIHIIDNSNGQAPQKIGFIELVSTKDMEVRNGFLYADSLMDLVVFDISDINNIKQVSRLKDVFPAYVPFFFEEDVLVDYASYQYNVNEILVGWDVEIVRKTKEEIEALRNQVIFDDRVLANAESVSQGEGGSLTRFKIVSEYLYAVDSHSIHIFDLDGSDEPIKVDDIFAGFDIETIFNRGDHLYLGSMRGMYIYNIEVPESPKFVSEFEHGTACDPVVVDDTYAYITLRAGNNCGAFDSSLQIVNIENIENPKLVASYLMDNPYGLGIKNELLFICDGSSGLKVYDKSDVNNLKMLNHFKGIKTYDVIPLENKLLMVGNNVLYQYKYVENGIDFISQFELE